jgi:hypothetical protein
MSYQQLPDFRFEGRDNGALSKLVTELNGSDSARQFGEASEALRTLADQLTDTDETLRRELGKLGIAWQGAAGDQAGTAFKAEADYADGLNQSGHRNSDATMVQSESNSNARNSMPPATTLNGATETNFGDAVGGFFGYETDHAAEVKQTNAARDQAIQALTQYTNASQDALNSFQAPGKPPNYEVTSTSSAVGPPVGTGIPGIGPTPHLPGGVPGGGIPGGVGPNLPGGSVLPPPQLPGGTTGIAPPITPGTTPSPTIAALPKVGGGPGLGLGLGLAGAAALGGAAATARSARVVRGGGGLGTGAAPKVPIGKPGVPGVGGNGTIGAGTPGKGTGVTTGMVAAEGEERLANKAGVAGKGGVGKAGGSMMQPAASGKGGPGEEDDEHVRKYGVDSDDVFGDERMVVQSVIGEEPEKK